MTKNKGLSIHAEENRYVMTTFSGYSQLSMVFPYNQFLPGPVLSLVPMMEPNNNGGASLAGALSYILFSLFPELMTNMA